MLNHLPYHYIAIEGNIGAGKTTLATRLSEELNALLILEQFEDNSFLPKFYEEPERYAFPLELSFLADRYQQLKNKLSQTDIFHHLTIADYFVFKSVIFAKNTLNADEYTLFNRVFGIIDSNLPKPDLLVYLYVDIPRLQANIRKRGREYEQNIQNEYLEKIQHGYLAYLKQQPQMRILLIDTNKLDFVAHENDYIKLKEAIFRPYEAGIHHIIL